MALRWCKVCRGWHDPEAWPSNCMPEQNMKRSDLAFPQIARTSLDDVWNPVDGKRYSNSRAFEAAVKAKGCEIIGNDSSIVTPKPKPVKSAPGLKDALQKAWHDLST